MKHTFIYKGRLSLNFDSLTASTTHYKKPDGAKAEYLYSKSADGLEFGFMEKPGTGAFAVTVGPVILDVPLKIDPARHTDGKRFGPSPMLFGNESAKRLIADAIRLNPQKAEAVTYEKVMLGINNSARHIGICHHHLRRLACRPSVNVENYRE